jgi:AcrR family transcriptional regulator
MPATNESGNNREKLILAGIRCISQRGLEAFSLRAVAADCGLSCAAPYRHFKNKNDLLVAILGYINDAWHREQTAIISEGGGIRCQLIRISMAYIRFLVRNPSFRTIIMMHNRSFTPEQRLLVGKLSERTAELVGVYVREAGLSSEAAFRKTAVIRALIYGYALMLSSGEIPDTDEGYGMIERVISREFDLD